MLAPSFANLRKTVSQVVSYVTPLLLNRTATPFAFHVLPLSNNRLIPRTLFLRPPLIT